jgi:transcriptional regulator with XRE-family HTH domain
MTSVVWATVTAVEPIDPALFERADLRAAQASHDIGALYRVLGKIGLSQRQIAERTGQSQSEVAEIVAGRRVRAYDVLVRIAEAFGIPREYMGLSFGAASAYAGGIPVANASEETDEEMRRRAVFLTAPVALWGSALLGKVPALPPPTWVAEPLPARLSSGGVAPTRCSTATPGTTSSRPWSWGR